MASTEGGVWGGVSPPPDPARNAFWSILKATKRSLLYLYADALSNLVLEMLKHDKI